MIKYFLMAIVAVILLGTYSFATLPNVKKLEGCIVTTMYEVKLCPESGHYVRLKDISQHMVDALLVSEDAAFFSHNGFDWFEMKQSFSQNWKSGQIQRGGSTLTQQLAKNVFLSKEKSYWRKVKEAYLTYALEKNFNKNQILEKYLNVVEFGEKIYGVKDAAAHYFHKAPRDLTPLEASFLAMLLPNPKAYSKSFRQGKLTPYAQKMIGVILHRLHRFRKMNSIAYEFASSRINDFPWEGISNSDFESGPIASDERDTPQGFDEEVIDEEALERLLEDELRGQPSAED